MKFRVKHKMIKYENHWYARKIMPFWLSSLRGTGCCSTDGKETKERIVEQIIFICCLICKKSISWDDVISALDIFYRAKLISRLLE